MEVFANPLVLVCVLAMPVAIIGLAKAWAKYKVAYKKNKEAQT